MYLEFTVTDEDVCNGTRDDVCECAVALALRRSLDAAGLGANKLAVCHGHVLIFAAGEKLWGKQLCFGKISRDVRDWIEAFDDGEILHGFSGEIELPDDCVPHLA